MHFLLRTIGVVILAVLSTSSSEPAEFNEFKQGHYINNKDEKKEGWIRYLKGNSPRVEYKETAESKKVKWVTPFFCKEFVMEDARFVRVPSPVMIRVGGLNRKLSNDFVRVFEEGKINLYMYYTESESKNIKDLTPVNVEIALIKKDAGLVPLSGNDAKTQQQLEDLFPRDPKAIKTLMSGNWDEIVKFVQEYNSK